MKAVILAGGKGTRGKPYTDFFPKAMIPIDGKPTISYVINALNSSKIIDEIIILTDLKGLGGQIQNYFKDTKNKKKLSFVQDSQSGTGGDLLHLAPKLKEESEFLLWFADNLCKIDIYKMHQHFKNKQSLACIATRSKRKEETGFAIVNDGIITEFREKPKIKLQMSECLGIYILSTKILSDIKKKSKIKQVNLSYDILEELSKKEKVSAYDIGNYSWIDAESPVILERNEKLVKKIIKQMAG